MKKKNLIGALILFLCLFQENNSFSQVIDPTPGQPRIIPYTHVREADVLMSKRVWRKIDLREKMNHPLYYPISPIEDRISLFDVLIEGIIEDAIITAYSPGVLGDKDEFTLPMTIEEVSKMIYGTDSVWTENIDGNMIQVPIDNHITSKSIKQYELKEEWFFDSKYSTMSVRIIGICPYIEKFSESGELIGYKPLFWVYFPDIRSKLVQHEVFNRQNDIRLTYDALFAKRMFSSFIVKESNVFDRSINEYKIGIDALLEAENIKTEIFNYEQDVWDY